MILQGMFDRGAMPALERLVQFTSARQQVLTHNVANLSTPFFKPRDLDPKGFQHALGRAIDDRRSGAKMAASDAGHAGRANPTAGPLRINDTDELRFQGDRLESRPGQLNEGILFHDQNNRDVERLMQKLAENTMAHRAGIELIRNQFDMIRLAIRERI